MTINAILVLWLMILPFRDFVLPADNPGALPESALLTTRIHAAAGAAALIFGVFVALRGNGLVPLPVAPEFPEMPRGEEDVVRIPAIQNFNGSDFSLVLPVSGLLSGTVLIR